MPSVSFIYRIGNNKTTYYGKFITNNLMNYSDSIDTELRTIVKHYLNLYRKTKNQPAIKHKIHIGVLSCSTEHSCLDDCSMKEKNCFDFYLFEINSNSISYVNGVLV